MSLRTDSFLPTPRILRSCLCWLMLQTGCEFFLIGRKYATAGLINDALAIEKRCSSVVPVGALKRTGLAYWLLSFAVFNG